jgi:hypothetical protein
MEEDDFGDDVFDGAPSVKPAGNKKPSQGADSLDCPGANVAGEDDDDDDDGLYSGDEFDAQPGAPSAGEDDEEDDDLYGDDLYTQDPATEAGGGGDEENQEEDCKQSTL